MADAVQFELDKNWDEFGSFLRDAAKSADATQRKKYLKMVGGIMLASERMIFDKDGAEAPGSMWKALKPSTKERRKKRRNLGGKRAMGMKILRDSGILRGSISPGRTNKYSVRDLKPWEIVIGTSAPYGVTHQYGRKAMTVSVPETKRGAMKVKAHTVRAHSVLAHSYTRNGKTVSVPSYTVKAHRVSAKSVLPTSVKAHKMKVPAIPPRPFIGWTKFALDSSIKKAQEWFIDRPWLKNKKGGN